MSSRILSSTLLGLILTVLTGNAVACGESLFRVGKGVAYREYSAPLPGTILAIATTEMELAMIERLVAAGHDVHVVADPSEIPDALGEHDFDIVLAYFEQREAVHTQLASASSTYIPVTKTGTDEAAVAESMYERSLSSDASVKKFLKTIHKTLKSRNT